jgi:flagellar motor component MotA
MKILSIILMFLSIIIRITLIYLNSQIIEFEFYNIKIPFDFLIFIFASWLFFLYVEVPKKNIKDLLKFFMKVYERYKNIKASR